MAWSILVVGSEMEETNAKGSDPKSVESGPPHYLVVMWRGGSSLPALSLPPFFLLLSSVDFHFFQR